MCLTRECVYIRLSVYDRRRRRRRRWQRRRRQLPCAAAVDGAASAPVPRFSTNEPHFNHHYANIPVPCVCARARAHSLWFVPLYDVSRPPLSCYGPIMYCANAPRMCVVGWVEERAYDWLWNSAQYIGSGSTLPSASTNLSRSLAPLLSFSQSL